MKTLVDVLFAHEQQINLVNRKLIRQLNFVPKITLIIFSCLGTKSGREELEIDLLKTLFFVSGKFKKTLRLIAEIEALGIDVEVIVILPDIEPRRTWGWKALQDDLTLAGEIMLEQGVFLPQNWQLTLWSTLESRYRGTGKFEKILTQIKPESLAIRQQVKQLAKFTERYHFPLGLSETATRQVAAYAFEGVVLEELFPNAILLQSETPAKDKDPLYQLLREIPLIIIHPYYERR